MNHNHLWHMTVLAALGLTFWVLVTFLAHLLQVAQTAGVK